MRIEILDGEAVVNTINASPEVAQAQHPGAWRIAEVQDDPAPEPAPDLRITNLAFVDRFTDAEAIGIDLASIGATVGAAQIRRYLDKVSKATYIDLAREDTQSGVRALEVAGLLGAGRADAILLTPIEDHERPR